jgi:ribosomal protein S18 acetylase RimI-like enzyme
MLADLSNLFRLTKAHIKPASEVLDRAFEDYPLHIALIPDESERKKKSRYYLEFVIRYSLLYGEVYATSPKLEAVIMWLPSKAADFTMWKMIWSGVLPYMFRLGRKTVSRMLSVADYTVSIHKRYAPFPHLYGWYIGVDPEFQGKGYGRTLMKAMLTRADSEKLPLYSETHTEEDVAMHVNYGYKLIHESVIPGTEITHWVMLRDKTG